MYRGILRAKGDRPDRRWPPWILAGLGRQPGFPSHWRPLVRNEAGLIAGPGPWEPSLGSRPRPGQLRGLTGDLTVGRDMGILSWWRGWPGCRGLVRCSWNRRCFSPIGAFEGRLGGAMSPYGLAQQTAVFVIGHTRSIVETGASLLPTSLLESWGSRCKRHRKGAPSLWFRAQCSPLSAMLTTTRWTDATRQRSHVDLCSLRSHHRDAPR